MIKLRTEEKAPETKPEPELRLNKDLSIDVVDEDGKVLACMVLSRGKRDVDCPRTIEARGYSTDWAEWDENGACIRLK